jgi:transcriptional regulator with XRE-family HTH domain
MKSEEAVKLGNKLRKAREHAGMSQADLAKKADISTNYYAEVERGEKRISYEKLQSVLKALNIKSPLDNI